MNGQGNEGEGEFLDCSESDAALAELGALKARLPPKLFCSVQASLDFIRERPDDLFVFEMTDEATFRATGLKLRHKPTAAFRELLVALRAVDLDRDAVGVE